MEAPTPPSDLVALVRERRVIPFVGAGASAVFGFPTWTSLLSDVAAEICDDIEFDELVRLANNDPLQIAEYLHIRSHSTMGPIRHVIENRLPSTVDVLNSGIHVELANLGAPQIYTTNYDDLIEKTLRTLGLSVNVVTLPRDIATAESEVTQVVKYHGDLRHDDTLVLTQSSYYRRLDFESPMDLKFRADLLGRSVLFMGYSFSDVNIRVIWFKLTEMMKDIPAEDRKQSYIIRIEPNKVLEALDRSVGLETIVLDPSGEVDPGNWSDLLADFLFKLGSVASPGGSIPGRAEPMFASQRLLDRVSAQLDEGPHYGLGGQSAANELARRAVVDSFKDKVGQLVKRMVIEGDDHGMRAPTLRLLMGFPVDPDIARYRRWGLYYNYGRELELFAARWADEGAHWSYGWDEIWSMPVSLREANNLARRAMSEIGLHTPQPQPDEDLFYVYDTIRRIEVGQIPLEDSDDGGAVRQLLAEVGDEVERIFPGTRDYQPNAGEFPDVSSLTSRLPSAEDDG